MQLLSFKFTIIVHQIIYLKLKYDKRKMDPNFEDMYGDELDAMDDFHQG